MKKIDANNLVLVRGALSSAPVRRTLPNGSDIVQIEVTTRDTDGVARSVRHRRGGGGLGGATVLPQWRGNGQPHRGGGGPGGAGVAGGPGGQTARRGDPGVDGPQRALTTALRARLGSDN